MMMMSTSRSRTVVCVVVLALVAVALVADVAEAKQQRKKASGKEEPAAEFGPCETCVNVLERIKKGDDLTLPQICNDLWQAYPKSFDPCHQVLNALRLNGPNARYWLLEGCYKYEIYNAKSWVRPCPSHVMCSALLDLNKEPFCKPMPMEDPFAFTKGKGPCAKSG
eukprot:TRINITY_DN28156_c0_g1_i1.p1 TRINITY_DN28156_c0_g1~~TRINITY_DN28156_c0_g1_i1.p1  ORF type:complete len:189 (+),score=70.57 TRINITY_DN28156_c0_g1_i1:72-569(+)